jgi:hypothetical protein
MADASVNRPSPGVEILQDLTAAIAGAACLMVSGAPADDIACARVLLVQARERAITLREVYRHG